MKKSEFIAKLQAIPGDPDVAILDWLTNLNEDDGEGSSEGVYSEFDVDLMEPDTTLSAKPAFKPWIALSFENKNLHIEISQAEEERTCRVCGCTDNDCRQCIAKTGSPCHWVAPDLCSACV